MSGEGIFRDRRPTSWAEEGREEDRKLRLTLVAPDYRLHRIGIEHPNYPHTRFSRNPPSRVKIYRAAPDDVTEIRPGDWVALDRSYAAGHLVNNRGSETWGKGRILSKSVPSHHVGWAGTDMNEWFYAPTEDES